MDPRPERHDEEAEEQVSRLLAEVARADEERMPEDVAGRLDDVLARLVAERADDPRQADEPPGTEPPRTEPRAGEVRAQGPVSPEEVVGVTELASRRRSWAPRLLVAAAAVSVAALGVGVGLDDLTGAGSGDSALTSEASDDGAPPEGAGDTGAGGSLERQPGPDAASDREAAPDTLSGSGSDSGEGGPVRLRSASLRDDVQRVADAGAASRDPGPADQDACVRPRLAPGDQWVRARLDGRPAVLVLRAPGGARRTAEVFACGSPRSPVASTTVVVR